MRRALALTAVTTALLAATACGSNTTPEAEAKPADRQAEAKVALEESVRNYTKALFGNSPDTGYALVSSRCQDSMPKAQFAAMAEQANHDYGALEIKTLDVDELSGNLARVSYGVGVPQFERKGQSWTREDGTWKWDACPAGEPNSQ